MCEIIVVTSGKGGVGKTTTTANLGAGLAMMRKKVLMIDTTSQSGCCDGIGTPDFV